MKFNNILERTFWEHVFIAAIRIGASNINACDAADRALVEWRIRNGS